MVSEICFSGTAPSGAPEEDAAMPQGGWKVVEVPNLHTPIKGCAARAEDARGTPTQSHISPSVLVYEDMICNLGLCRREDGRWWRYPILTRLFCGNTQFHP